MQSSKSMLGRVGAFVGISLGAFALAAVAGTWTAPAQTPPLGNVDAPLNVGATTQYKAAGGMLGIGRSPTNGSIFDVAGKAWADALGITGDAFVGGTATITTLKVVPNQSMLPGNCDIQPGAAVCKFTGKVLKSADEGGTATWQTIPDAACLGQGGAAQAATLASGSSLSALACDEVAYCKRGSLNSDNNGTYYWYSWTCVPDTLP